MCRYNVRDSKGKFVKKAAKHNLRDAKGHFTTAADFYEQCKKQFEEMSGMKAPKMPEWFKNKSPWTTSEETESMLENPFKCQAKALQDSIADMYKKLDKKCSKKGSCKCNKGAKERLNEAIDALLDEMDLSDGEHEVIVTVLVDGQPLSLS